VTEVFVEYENVIDATDASVWAARACGRPLNRKKWEAWIEFIPLSAGESPVRTPRETTQKDRAATVEWATGITPPTLKDRSSARTNVPPLSSPKRRPRCSMRRRRRSARASVSAPRPRAILDPYAVFAEG
jgi:hypothetical protein